VALAFRFGNFGVYVYDERGQRHHLPHAHIKLGGQRFASVFLLSLQVYDNRQRLPPGLMNALRTEQERLLKQWAELNGDD
jgi:hypothetical protein